MQFFSMMSKYFFQNSVVSPDDTPIAVTSVALNCGAERVCVQSPDDPPITVASVALNCGRAECHEMEAVCYLRAQSPLTNQNEIVEDSSR
jgi:hypothetical protein